MAVCLLLVDYEAESPIVGDSTKASEQFTLSK